MVGFWVGPHRFFHPGFLSVVQWGHWLSKSLEKISHKRIPTESLPNGSTQRVAGGIYSQLRSPKPPFLNVRIRIICWNTIWTVNYIFIISYFFGISFFSLRNWKGLTLTFSSPVHRPLAKQMGGPPRAKELLEFGSRKVIQLGNLETEAPLSFGSIYFSPLVCLDVEFVTGDCEWKGWGLGWKLMKRRLRLKCSNIIEAFSECAHIKRWGFHPWNRKIPSLGKAEQLIWTMPCLQRKKTTKMGLCSIYQKKWYCTLFNLSGQFITTSANVSPKDSDSLVMESSPQKKWP